MAVESAGTPRDVLRRLDRVTEGVPWTPAHVCHLLFGLAAARERPQILEVSCGFGKATAYLASAARRTMGTVYAVDRAIPTHEGRTVHDLLERLGGQDASSVTLGLDARWFLLDLFRRDPHLRIDLAFIDCSHTVEVDSFVALCAWTHLRPGGTLVFDDLDWTPARQDPPGAGYSRPDVAHVRVLFDYVRSLPDAGDDMEWDGGDGGWPLGLVRKSGVDSTPLRDAVNDAMARER